MNKNVQVISLPRSADRRASFAKQNAHIAYEFFDAVDGSQVGPVVAHLDDLFAPGLPYKDGAYGCALSHRALWRKVLADGEPMTIAEDDAIFRGDFHEMSEAVIGGLPADWEIVLHGWNFDSILSLNAMPAVSPAVMIFDQAALRRSIAEFKRIAERPVALRLDKCFGSMAYSISPAGARRLLAKCFPLTPFSLFFPGLNREIANNGIDIAMNRWYANMKAYCCFPPLAVSMNEHSESTIGPR